MSVSSDLENLSVLISYFNKEDFVPGLFETIRQLLFFGASVIIINDGSNEKSKAALSKAIEKIAESKSISERTNSVKIFHQSNVGSATTRNRLVSLTETDYLVFLDADDQIEVEVLIQCYKEMKNSSAGLLVSGIKTNDSNLQGFMPIEVSENTIFKTRELEQLFPKMGYSRYIYRKSLIKENMLLFIPEKTDLDGKHFILDDVFWMIQLSEVQCDVIVTPEDIAFYKYFKPELTQESRFRYREQEALMPLATRIYLRKRRELRSEKIRETEIEKLLFNLDANHGDLTPKRKLKNSGSYLVGIMALLREAPQDLKSKLIAKVFKETLKTSLEFVAQVRTSFGKIRYPQNS